ncbi:serine-rich adhesin for platelets-like isoform X3 [Daphnia pulex]|nr:serine-rich adhesin for platelets-like isoform X3 [Daphnia pulex]
MPMLDLLIHVTAANKISPAAHLLQVTDEEGRLLPHKPSTPIGSLNAHKVYIVAKNRLMADRSGGRSTNAKSSSASQFEQSFRVQVRLPRNQLFVTRVTGRTQLADLLHTVCNEKALDPRHYELRHPVNLDERLRLNSCLDDYKLQEVVLVPVCGKSSATLLTPAVSVSDLSSPSNSMNRKTATVTASNSKMSGKSTLKPTTSEAALAGLEKKKRGLLGLLGFGKHKKGSSMGDSSISSDSAGDRSISPSRSEEPAPPPPVVEPVAPTPPSPVLFSKRLAEEAVAKRNSRLMLSQMSTEASTTTTTSPNDAPPLRKTISTTSNGVAAASSAPTKPGAKKKRAPAPPQPQSSLNGMNGPPKAASEVSTYSTSSSGSNYVSPSTSVIHHSEEEVVLRSPSPKLSYLRQESNNVARQRQSDSGCSSPVRSPRSNLITTPGNSSSNLTQVSSTSNASLASVFKKRKAPVPPPALEEQVETSDKLPPATPVVVVVVNGGSHDDSDRASSVSDQLSSVSDMSSTRKSAPTPDIIEPPIVVQLTPQHHQPSSVAPIPAARNKIPRPVKSATASARREGRVESVVNNHREQPKLPNSSSSSLPSSPSSDADDLTLDSESLNMFSSRNELNQTTKAQRAAAVDKRPEQLKSPSIERNAEAMRLKFAQERQQQRKKAELEMASARIETVEQRTASPPEVEERSKRKKWDRSPPKLLQVLATARSGATSDDDDEMTLAVPVSPMRRSRIPSVVASRTSSVSEFFSLSEDEDEMPIPVVVVVAAPKEFRSDDEVKKEEDDDPDATFAAMCAALARRKQRGEPQLPNDVSPTVPIETLQPLIHVDGCSSGSSSPPGVDGDASNGVGFWHQSSNEQGWITEKNHETTSSTSPRSTSPALRRSSSFNDVPGDSLLFPLLSNSSFSAVLSSRGDYEDLPLLLINNDADGRHSQDLDSPRSSEGDSSNNTSERPANSVSSEDDYELLNYRREKIEPAIVEKNGPFSEAHEKEEVVVSEPIYTMVIKSPRPLVAVNVGPEKDDKSGQTNGDVHVDEPDRMEVKASPIPAEEGPEMERDAGDGQTESPIMWEYKLPAPPTPFQDSIQSPLDKLQIASESDSSRSRRSSMSTDSLQHNRSAEEEDLVKDSPRSSIGSQEEPVAPQVVPKISIKEDCDTNEDAIKLDLGAELQGESATEEPAVNGSPVEEVLKVVVVEEKVVVLQSSDPEAKPYGVESTTDEPLSLEPTSLPPVPSTLPPCDSDDDSIGQPDMRFSIATYTVRVNKDSTYEKKLARSGSPEELTKVQIEPVAVPEKKVDDPLPLVAETKEPETIADPVKTDENSGSSSAAVPPAAQLPLPMLNADFIQQFQNALHSITDPKARALQEEFLRLQQQFLTLQMQAAVQQNVTPVSTESTSVAAHCETIKVEDKVVEIEVPKVLDPPIEFCVESDSKRILPVESPVEIPLKTIEPIENQSQKEQIEVEPEATVYRYAGPPQVKLDTWKPGRPRSEVIDFSRSSSFNVPLAPVEKKIDLPVKNTPAPTVAAMESPASPTVATIPEEVVVVPAQLPEIAEEESKIKSIVIVPEVEETLDVREKIEHIESSSNNSSSSTSPVPKPVVLRKSSFMTARPFEARPVSMPIKRPNFTPMVIQPVPFVFGKIRAPEVRGFASLPPDNRSEMQSIRTTGSAGIAPFSAVNKPRPVSTVSKENPTVVIRNKLIESARRPSAELNGIPIKLEDSSDQLEKEVKESVPIVSETRRASNSSRPLSMPMSSSLLLAAGAGGAVNKPQPVVSEISIQPISPTAQPSVVSGADPTSISGRRSLSSKFVRKVDPREELLNSIRSFANGGSLKKTGTSLEK